MSYKLKVIKDNPIGFWPLDELFIIKSYNDSTIFYNDLGYYNSASSYVDSPQDVSGSGNNGLYNGTFPINENLIPLISGGLYGTEVSNSGSISLPASNDYRNITAKGRFGDKYSSDNDFSIEFWFYPKITTSAVTPLIADTSNNIGIYWDNETILFRLQNEYLYYTPTNIKKVLYVVATYTTSSMSLYIDGYLVASKSLTNFKFTNSSLSLSIGPTTSSADSFIVDAPAIYRYALNDNKILLHFKESLTVYPIQIVKPDGGTYFPLSDYGIRKLYSYSYPQQTSWKNFKTSDVFYDEVENSMSLIKNTAGGTKTVSFVDFIRVPTKLGLTSSKVEWDGSSGVTIETSLDGVTYEPCTNGSAVPQYSQSSFDSVGQLFIRITLSSTNLSKYIPKIKRLTFTFFKDKKVAAYNSGSLIEYVNTEYSLGSGIYDILSKEYKNGLRCGTNGGFKFNTNKSIRTIEFFYTPSSFNNSGLVSSIVNGSFAASNYSWRNSGTIEKTNISAIYVNGVDKTSETNVSSVFALGELNHVVIVYTAAISGDITFNYSSYGATNSLYQHIAIYPTAFERTTVYFRGDPLWKPNAVEHYNLYIGRASLTSNDSSLTITENAISVYQNEWEVIQGV